MYRQESPTELSEKLSSVIIEVPRASGYEAAGARTPPVSVTKLPSNALSALRRLGCFFAVLVVMVFALNAMITSGLRRIKTSQYGAWNQMMDGKINAQIVITGSSRAASHYDPRIIAATTGRSAFNLGRNGSQTDMQIAVLKAYLEHNHKPEIVVHNLDAFTFETSHEVYAFAQYVPYLYDREIYVPLRKITPDTWKSRYVPLYGYVVDDMNFSWMLGIRGFFGWSPKNDFFLGFDPRPKPWTNDFDSFRASNRNGVSWPIEPEGIQLMDGLARLCQERGIQLIFVYSPEYSEMQKLTNNRAEVFDHFHELATRYHVPLWDYSDWSHASDTQYFTNSQHLNSQGAALFSEDIGSRLQRYVATQASSNAALRVH
jgi:hypothetical protein